MNLPLRADGEIDWDAITITLAPIPGARSAAQVRHWQLMHHVETGDEPCADCLAYYGVGS